MALAHGDFPAISPSTRTNWKALLGKGGLLLLPAARDARTGAGDPPRQSLSRRGAGGLFIEGLRSHSELKRVGKAFRGTPLAMTMMERRGRMPWVSPAEIHEPGFSKIMYPTTLLFQSTRAVARALSTLCASNPLSPMALVDLD
jgi:hypothetical protein